MDPYADIQNPFHICAIVQSSARMDIYIVAISQAKVLKNVPYNLHNMWQLNFQPPGTLKYGCL